MSYELTGNRHMGAAMKKKQAYLNEWKIKARRKILPGYPIEKPFKTKEEVDAYLNVDRLICLLCGKTYKSLCTHLLVHGTNADQYKEKYGLPFGCGLTCISTKEMNIKHGHRLIAEGIFRAPTPEEHEKIVAKRSRHRKQPQYAINASIKRITGREIIKIFEESHYLKILEIAEKENKHPTDVCKENKNILPSTSMLHQFKRNNISYKQRYNEIVKCLPFAVRRKHGKGGDKDFIEQIQNLKNKHKTNAEISHIMGVHENTIEKYSKKFSLTKPSPTTCKNGLHAYPGYRKRCQPCNTLNSRKHHNTMDRNISKKILIDRTCSDCNKIIQTKRIYGAIKTKYCESCKTKRYYESQKKYAKEKRPYLKAKQE